MKKLITLTMVAAMLLAMSACGGDGDAETTAKGTDAATVAGTEVATDAGSEASGTSSATAGDETVATTPDVTLAAGETAAPFDDETVGGEDNPGGETPSGNYEYDVESLYPLIDADGNEISLVGYTTEPTQIKAGKSKAVKFTVDKGWIYSMKVKCPSWSNNIGTLQFDLYRWVELEKGSMTDSEYYEACYKATVATDPILSKLAEDFVDNEAQGFEMEDEGDTTISNGTFLFVVSNPLDEDTEENKCGVYTFPSELYRGDLAENNNKHISDVSCFSGSKRSNFVYMMVELEMTFNEGTLS